MESYINAAVATMYPKEKTKWLNILHAGWPGGMALAGILGIAIGYYDPTITWQTKVALTFLPTAVYGVHRPGTAYRMDEVPIPLRPFLPGNYPDDAEVLDGIRSRLRQ